MPINPTVESDEGSAFLQFGSVARAPTGDWSGSMLIVSSVVDGKFKIASPPSGMSSSSSSFVSSLVEAETASGILRSAVTGDPRSVSVLAGGMYKDQHNVELTIQVRNNEIFSHRTAPAGISVIVSPSGDIRTGAASNGNAATAVAPAPYYYHANCPTRASGICHLDVHLPASFYGALVDGELLNVKYSLDSAISQPPVELGHVPSWTPHLLGDDALETLYAVLPSRDLYPGDVFTVEIRSRFTASVKTAEVRVVAGEGLEFIGDVAAKASGKDVFFGTMDRESQLVSASLARKESTPFDGGSGTPTDELLFSIKVRVHQNASPGSNSNTILLEGIRFKDGNEALLAQQSAGVIVSRGGVAVNSNGTIHVKEDVLVGSMAYTDGPAELLNTAILSGIPLRMPITIVGIFGRGGETDITRTCQCSSSNTEVLHVDGCTAVLDGTETAGAREVVVLASCTNGLSASISFRVHIPVALELATTGLTGNTMKPVAGWMRESSELSECGRLHYQPGNVVASASFNDGTNPDGAPIFADVDVTRLVRLESTSPSILTLKDDPTAAAGMRSKAVLHAVSEGRATVVARSTAGGAPIASIDIDVASEARANQLAVIGIDFHTIASLGSVLLDHSSSPPYSRGVVAHVRVTPPTAKKLQYEDDSMTAVAWAIMDDHSRIELRPSNGLVLSSLNLAAVHVEQDHDRWSVIVPSEPSAHNGPLLRVRWQMAVTPPPAEKMTASISASLLVCAGDVASDVGAGFPSAAQLSVSLHFVGNVKDGVERDRRSTFEISAGAPFSVNSNGTVVASSNGVVGVGTIAVYFAGQNVTATVDVEVAKFDDLVVKAIPEPSYSGSNALSISSVSAIQCTSPPLFQRARSTVSMHRTNGVTKYSANQHTNFRIRSVRDSEIISESSRIVTAARSGEVEIFASFASAESTVGLDLVVEPLNVPVAFVGLANLALVNPSNNKAMITLTGSKGSATAQLTLSATLSDGRKYDTLVDRFGAAALPNVVTFASAAEGKVSVGEFSGQATLLDNHYEEVALTATTCTGIVSTVAVACNLKPWSIGDVDLGQTTGPPIAPQDVGQTFTVPVRVNTGNRMLAAFNLRTQFDPTMLEPVLSKVKHTIASKHGAVDMKASVSESGNEIVLAAVIQKSKVRGTTTGVSIAEVAFTAIRAGETVLTGIAVQLLDTTAGNPQQIGEPNFAFEAGKVPLIVHGSDEDGLGRRHRRLGGGMMPSAHYVLSAHKQSLVRLNRPRSVLSAPLAPTQHV